MSSEQDKDLVAKKKCMLHIVLLDLINIYICILPYVCSRDILQLLGKGLVGFLWKYVSNSHRMHL